MCDRSRTRALNDAFRSEAHNTDKGLALLTRGINGLGNAAVLQIIEAVQQFDDFDEANDPYEEHDFGAFEHGPDTIFWKIDYYNQALNAASADPGCEIETRRVLTVMLASEY